MVGNGGLGWMVVMMMRMIQMRNFRLIYRELKRRGLDVNWLTNDEKNVNGEGEGKLD